MFSALACRKQCFEGIEAFESFGFFKSVSHGAKVQNEGCVKTK